MTTTQSGPGVGTRTAEDARSTTPIVPSDEQGRTHAEQASRAARSLFEGQQAARRALAAIDWEAVLRRFLQDAITAALPDQWDARSEVFEAARPHPDDFNGNATPAELAERDARNAATAQECRNHAAVLRGRWDA